MAAISDRFCATECQTDSKDVLNDKTMVLQEYCMLRRRYNEFAYLLILPMPQMINVQLYCGLEFSDEVVRLLMVDD